MSPTVTIYNRSRQLIPLQVRKPNGDFFLNEQAVYVRPGGVVQIEADHLNSNQIQNLQLGGHIQVINGQV